jgi:hypothetical protein
LETNDEKIEILRNNLKEKLDKGHGEMILSIGVSGKEYEN